jgi:hypothetical protein
MFKYILLAAAATACPHTTTPTEYDDGIAAMCGKFRDLGCQEGLDIYNDNLPGDKDVPNQTCEQFFGELRINGIDFSASCLAEITDCDQIETVRYAKTPTCETD